MGIVVIVQLMLLCLHRLGWSMHKLVSAQSDTGTLLQNIFDCLLIKEKIIGGAYTVVLGSIPIRDTDFFFV